MRAEVLIEDETQENGQPAVKVRFVFPDGFDKESGAHQMASHIRRILDGMAQAGELTALTDEEQHGDVSGLEPIGQASGAANDSPSP